MSLSPENACEASLQQKRAWLLRSSNPSAAAGRTLGVYHLRGSVDATEVHHRLLEAVDVHEILRTAFQRVPGLRFCHQVIESRRDFEWKVVGQGVHASIEDAFTALWTQGHSAAEEAEFSDLRAVFATVDTNSHVLMLSLSSMSADIATLHQLVAIAVGQPTGAMEVLQYGDFAGWQYEVIESARDLPNTHIEHGAPLELPWRSQLTQPDGGPPGLARFTLPRETIAAIEAVTAAHGWQPETFVLGCWYALLHRLSGSTNIAVDEITLDRDFAETLAALGNYQIVRHTRATPSADTPLVDLMADLTAQLGSARTSLSTLQELSVAVECGTVSSSGNAVGFRFNNYCALTSGGIGWLPLAEYCDFRPYELMLSCSAGPAGWTGAIHYDHCRYPKTVAESMAAQFMAVIAAAATRPSASIDELTCLTETEAKLVLEFVARLDRPQPQRLETMISLFAERAAAVADRIAVGYLDVELTFAELGAMVNQLANYLREHGVGRNVPVALFVDRSTETVSGMFGVLVAGGAYLPLDVDLPTDRIRTILDDAKPRLILTQSWLRKRLPESDTPVVCLDNEQHLWATSDTSPPESHVLGDDLAYIIYTSGTTGRPKGVAVTHNSVSYLWSALRDEIYMQLGDTTALRVGVNGPLSFDTSVKQLVQLFSGHAIYPIPADLRLDPEQLVDYLERMRIDVVDCTPSQVVQWLELGGLEERERLPKAVLLGGEPVSPALWRRLSESPIAFFNLYGPTECTVDTTTSRIVGPCPSVGRALPGTRVYVCDDAGRLAPLGTVGELCVSGPGVARGYLGDSVLTAERFGTDEIAGYGRLYRTGDLGRYLPDGTIDIRGRTDRQVKVRGFRVELGEIESALLSKPGVLQAAVVEKRRESGESMLLGYVVSDPPTNGAHNAIGGAGLRGYLSARLPEHMVPGAIILLPRLPLTSSGKVDYAALPDPTEPADRQTSYVAPRDDVEQAIADIWSQILRVDKVGVHDNFFELGGDSIMCIQVASRAKRQGLRITALQIIQYQTIAELSAVVNSEPIAIADHSVVTGEVELTPIQHRFFERNLADPHHWNQSVQLILNQELPTDILASAIGLLIEHHDVLRARFTQQDGRWRQTIMPAVLDTNFITAHDLSGVNDAQLASVIATHADVAQHSLNIHIGPLLRAIHLRSDGCRPDRLIVVVHHLVIDGVSWRILLEDLSTAIEALLLGRPVKLPSKTASYRDWSAFLLRYATTGSARDQRDTWLAQLPQAKESLPTDGSGGPAMMATAREHVLTFDREQTTALLRAAAQSGRARVSDVLLTALVSTLGVWAELDELPVELEGHGRVEHLGDLDLSRTVGWFTSVYPVRLPVDAGARFTDRLASVRRVLDQVVDGGIGYGISRYLDKSAGAATARREVDVAFNYLGQFDSHNGSMLFTHSSDASGVDTTPDALRSNSVTVEASILEGQLRVYWTVSPELHSESTVTMFLDQFVSELHAFAAGDASERSIERDRQVAEPLSLTPVQQVMVERISNAPRFGQYLYQWAVHLRSELNRAAFASAWARAIERHESLRTGIQNGVGVQDTVQAVHAVAELNITWLDWSDLSVEQLAERQREYLFDAQQRGVVLDVPPLIDLAVATTKSRGTTLLITFHLLPLDAGSFARIVDEVMADYHAICSGAAIQPPARSGGAFRAYLEWLTQHDYTDAERFWHSYLDGTQMPSRALPIRPVVPAAAREYVELVSWLSGEATQAIKAFSREHRVSPAAMLQGAWALALRDETGESDFLIAVIISGLPQELDLENPIGRYANTLPVRVRVPTDGTFGAWIRRQQEGLFAVLDRPYVGEGQIAVWHGLPSHTQLTQTLVNWEPAPLREAFTHAHWKDLAKIDTVQDPDLPLKLAGTMHDRLRMSLAYMPDQVDANTAERLFDSVLRHLDRFVIDPQCGLEVHR
ncbi:non-ribosomal peptide synthetase [Mycobacteroides abscessus]|uniref:non-ribosomal peptide synthetase n=1 Tax=Mycobacteroides abscessus TaxID=36809 RepID=UPI000C2661F9|nr:non-ribosomal peptide synthetase [Mycobacteroides abscessus]